MANGLYDKAREAFLSAGINWSADSLMVVLVDKTKYTVNLATDQYLSSIISAARVATSTALAAKTVTAGVADAGDVTFPAVTGAASGALVIYKSTGTDSTSPLIAYIDVATGLPVTPNGGDITVAWDNGANKIFKL